jgi:hypothetical protein
MTPPPPDEPPARGIYFECPACGHRSHDPNHVGHAYCPRCRKFWPLERVDPALLARALALLDEGR